MSFTSWPDKEEKRPKDPGDGAGNVPEGGDCPYCGEKYDNSLAKHIRRECPERDPELVADGGQQTIPRPDSIPVSYEWEEDGTLARVVFKSIYDDMKWAVEGEMEIVDPEDKDDPLDPVGITDADDFELKTDGGTDLGPIEFWFSGDHFVLESERYDEFMRRVDESGAEKPCPGVAERIIRDMCDPTPESKEAVTDGGEVVDEPEGAIDNTFDENERDARETLAEAVAEHDRELTVGDIAIDLVTRQPLYITGVAAASLPEYYDREGFDLLSYNGHPYLPVRMSDTVLNCVFLPRNLEGLHKMGREYAYPEGRLARVPVERAGGEN